jgi:CheY-like chemotaxis protein
LRPARETIPDIMLVYMLLPKLGGREVMRALKEGQQTAGVPVLVFSSLPQANETKLKGEGVAGYFENSRLLQTGNGEKELVEIIARLIQESRTGTEAAAAKAGHATG